MASFSISKTVFFRSLLLILLSVSELSFAGGLRCTDLPSLFEYYFKRHYAFRKLTKEIREHTVEQYIKELDQSKTLLTEQDVEMLKKDVATTFDKMEAGDCKVLLDSTSLLVTRAKENEAYVKKFLGPDYKLDETTEIMLDASKRPYPKSLEERQATLAKLVHLLVSNYLQTDEKLPEAKKHVVHRYELVTKRLSERKPSDSLAGFAEAFSLALDPHSSYMSPDSFEDFQIQMQLSLEGIGASLSSQDGFTVIEALIPGGGAERSKLLKPKDKIMAVAQDGGKAVSVMDMDLREIVKMIRGKKGTKVHLSILRQGKTSTNFEATIIRDKIDIKDQAAKITYETRKVGNKTLTLGIIELPSFYGGGGRGSRSSSVDIRQLLNEAKAKNVDGVVLNLFKNGGGLLDEAVKIGGLFIKKGGIVATKDEAAKVQILSDEDEAPVYSGPLILLTSRLSASASEILAGAMKDYKRAIIVGGDHTFGKGSVQSLSDLPQDLGAVKITTGMFFLPGGVSTQRLGVISDIALPTPFDREEIGEETLSYALPRHSIDSFVSKDANWPKAPEHWQPVDASTVSKLAQKSKARVEKDAEFKKIIQENEEAAKNKGIVKLSELRKKSKEKKKKDPTKDDAKSKPDAGGLDGSGEKKDEVELPLVKESENIMFDLIGG